MLFNIPGDPLSIQSETLGNFFGLPITNTMTTGILDDIFLIIFLIIVARFSVKKPGKLQIGIEMLINSLENFIVQIAGSEKVAKKVTPLVGSMIIFILFSNLVTLFLPILSGFTWNGVPLFRTYTNDFNTTLAFSVTVVVLTQIYSVFTVNPLNYFFRFVQINQIPRAFKKGGKGPLVIIDLFLGLLDLVSEIAKVVSLSLRLFGNIFAGELLVGVLMSKFAILLPLPIMILSLLSGAIQALVFGALSTSFFAGVLAVNPAVDENTAEELSDESIKPLGKKGRRIVAVSTHGATV